LIDGFEAEREQDIAIDVAYRYFSNGKRSFVVAETPGHEQYTRWRPGHPTRISQSFSSMRAKVYSRRPTVMP
jgi:hypothetical protein